MDKQEIKEIGEKIEKPMGDDDIKKYLPSTKIITNKELNKYNDIDELFDNKKYCDSIIMLYLDSPNAGHWVALSKYGDTIEFFDSYGNPPNKVYDFVPSNVRNVLGTGKDKMAELLKKTKKKVIYNPVKYQEDNKDFIDINTCGRHCCFRILKLKNNGMTLPEYYDLMKEAKNQLKLPYDAIVSELINM